MVMRLGADNTPKPSSHIETTPESQSIHRIMYNQSDDEFLFLPDMREKNTEKPEGRSLLM
jgi:hypothetical protein